MVDSVLVYDDRDPLFGLQPAQLEEALRDRLRGRVDAAYLFGSYGTPAFGAQSDIDLLLVQRTSIPFVERSRQFMDLLDIVPTMDLLVYTPEEFAQLTTDPSPGFWTEVARTKRRLL